MGELQLDLWTALWSLVFIWLWCNFHTLFSIWISRVRGSERCRGKDPCVCLVWLSGLCSPMDNVYAVLLSLFIYCVPLVTGTLLPPATVSRPKTLPTLWSLSPPPYSPYPHLPRAVPTLLTKRYLIRADPPR